MRVSWLRRSPLMVMTMVALVAASIGAGSAGGERDTVAVPSSQTKKKCKLVKKKVHAKVRKVRVCTNAKPAPSLPSRVSVTLDAAHAAKASVTADSGATVSAGRATLSVPAGAVDKATTVTMTPVKRLGGLGGQLLGAVQLQPDGLRLQRPVTLTIDVPSTRGIEAFSYVGKGRDFHLYPLKVEGGKAILTLFHFSGHGVAKGLPPPSVDALRTGLAKYIQPEVDAAKRSGALSDLSKAVFDYSLWKAEVDHLAAAKRKLLATDVSALEKGLGAALRKLADEQHKICVDKHKIVETGKKINEATDLIESVRSTPRGPLTDAQIYALAQRAKCEIFKLDFDSTIIYTGSKSGSTSKVRVRDLPLTSDNLWQNTRGPEYYVFEPPPNRWEGVCARTVTYKPGYVKPFEAKLAPVLGWYHGGSPPQISMEVFSGELLEVFTYSSCGNGLELDPDHSRDTNNYWSSGMNTFGHSRWTISDWTYDGGAIFADKTYSGSKVLGPDFQVTEVTTLTLRHTPE